MGRICIFSIILLCCVCTSENAFSVRYWQDSDIKVSYDPNDKTITIDFLFYHYHPPTEELSYLNWCEFSYGLWGDIDVYGDQKTTNLFTASAEAKLGLATSLINLSKKQQSENIMLLSLNYSYKKKESSLLSW